MEFANKKKNNCLLIVALELIVLFFSGSTYCQDIKISETDYVANVRAKLVSDKVEITFDLVGIVAAQRFNIHLFSSHDGYSKPLTQVTGDLTNQLSGDRKKIFWDPTKETEKVKGEITFEVSAESIYIPPKRFATSSKSKIKYKDLYILLKAKEYDHAAPFLEEYLQSNPNNGPAHFFMAEMLERQNDQAALYHYKSALKFILPSSQKEFKEFKLEEIQEEYGNIVVFINNKISKYEFQVIPKDISENDFTYSERYALIIGNSAYADVPLKNPANDASVMSATLSALGFEVDTYIDISRSEMRAAIYEFGEKLKENNGVGLFYYAGHGIQYQGKNYLVPINAQIKKSYEIEDECISADIILRMMELYQNPLNIIILDACRNNPYSRGFRDLGQGLSEPKNAPIGSLIAFATGPGSVAADGKGDNGLYTSELIKAIQVPGLTIEEVFKLVRNNVIDISNEEQIPWESSTLRGSFYFAGKAQKR